MSDNMFNSEVELSKFLGSLDIIQHAFRAVSQTTLTYDLHTISGITILAFNGTLSDDYTTRFLDGEFDLVSSEDHKQAVDFILTKVNSSFLINKAAVELFELLSDDLKDLEKKHIYTPLVITGSGLGGYLAILSALRLHQAIDVEESNGAKKTKRPICITFGAPLVGDVALQRAISERPQWKSSFLNVVANKDPVATFFTSKTPYKPLGNTLFCTESGGHSAFEDQDEVLAVLDAIASSNAAGNKQTYDYGNVLGLMRKKVLYRGVTESGDFFNSSSLKAGITLQLKEVGVLNDISNDLIKKTEERKTKMIRSKRNVYEPTKKLNEMKISLTYMEWYMKSKKPQGGYYDSYKNAETKDEIERKNLIVKHQRILNQYWKKIVDDKDRMPQTEGAKLRTRWLLGGTNYRRIVEPLDIAEYYRNGNTNYIQNRPNHYKLLQKWADELQKDEDKKNKDNKDTKRTKAASLTEDSCFWANVEEALISLNELTNGGSRDEIEKKLERFEANFMLEINNLCVSPEIFIEGCSFMKWWNEYKAYRGSSYVSDFAKYMNNKKYGSYK